MYRLFIVDDETEAREGLQYFIDWEKYGIEVLGAADDGQHALEAISRDLPDIVLTDVKMPVMDGIELANKLKELYPKIHVIFISSYGDQYYLRQALKVDAIDYILKPLDLSELDATMRKLIGKLENDSIIQNRLMNLNAKIKENLPILREKFFITLIRDGYDERFIEGKLEFLNIKLPLDGKYCVIVLNVDDKAVIFDGISESDKQIISFSIINISEELISEQCNVYIFENRLGEFVGILQYEGGNDAEDLIYQVLNDVKDCVLKYLKISVTIGIGYALCSIFELSKSYQKAYENAEQKFHLGKNRVIAVDSLDTENGSSMPELDVLFQKIKLYVTAGDEEKLFQQLNQTFEKMRNKKLVNKHFCRNACFQMLLIAMLQAIELNVQDDSDEHEYYNNLFKLETISDMSEYTIKIIMRICGNVFEKRSKKSNHMVKEVKKIIEAHYKENIGLKEIAEKVYMSKNYLCSLFNQETGQTISEYLTQVRINHAKELLAKTHYKLYDICYAVGYSDTAHFSKVFKKITGQSPKEYRNSL